LATPPMEMVALAQAQEALRQEQETFNQLQRQDARAFILRATMGWIAAASLPGIGFTSGWILFHSNSFTTTTVNIAAGTLLVDSFGFLASVWKIVLGRGPERLTPITDRQGSVRGRERKSPT
jgi:hypothetical protein